MRSEQLSTKSLETLLLKHVKTNEHITKTQFQITDATLTS